MKPFLLALSLTTALALPTLAGAHDTAQNAMPAEDAAAPVVATVEAFSTALKAGDLAKAGTYLAEDVLILESGGAEHSRQEYLSGHATHDAAFLKNAQIDLKQRAARVDGDLAWVGTESELRATANGAPMTLMSTETMVLKRMPAGWRIVHIHWSSGPKH